MGTGLVGGFCGRSWINGVFDTVVIIIRVLCVWDSVAIDIRINNVGDAVAIKVGGRIFIDAAIRAAAAACGSRLPPAGKSAWTDRRISCC